MTDTGRALITAAAIARLAGVGRAAVSNWRKRYPDFPAPAGGSDASPVYDRAEVIAWLTRTGKAGQLATAGQTTTGTQRIGDPDWDFDAASTKAPREPGAQAPGRLPSSGVSWSRMPRVATRAMRDRSITDLPPRDLLAAAMVALLPRATAAGASGDEDPAEGQGYEAPRPVVLDPACGTGALLQAAAARFGERVRLVGQETDEHRAKIAAYNLSHAGPYEIHAGDSLADDRLAHYFGQAAAVVCEPPRDAAEWPADELATDPRWEFGIPAPRDGELAWVQHCYAYLKPRGVAVVAVPARACVQPSGEHIRAALVRQGVLTAVIALPVIKTETDLTATNLSKIPARSGMCLWVLRRPHASDLGADPGPVTMIDLSGFADMADVPREHAAWLRLLDATDPTVSRAIPRLRLLDEAAGLLPSRYVAARALPTARDINRVTGRLARLYASAGQVLPRYDPPAQPARLSHVTLAELERVGALAIRPRDATPKRGDVLLRTQGRPPTVATGTATDDAGVAQVVEVDESRLDPHFVAIFLRADVAALPVANTLGAVNRDDLRRCRIPRMPLAGQRRYGDAFRQLLQLDATLQALAATSGRIIEQMVYGLTAGTLAPNPVTPNSREGETSEQ